MTRNPGDETSGSGGSTSVPGRFVLATACSALLLATAGAAVGGSVKGVARLAGAVPDRTVAISLCRYQSTEAREFPAGALILYGGDGKPSGILWVGNDRTAARITKIPDIADARTDASGAFLFSGVPEGQYAIAVAGLKSAAGEDRPCSEVVTIAGKPRVISITSSDSEVDVGTVSFNIGFTRD